MPQGKPTKFGRLGRPTSVLDLLGGNEGKPVVTTQRNGRKPPVGGTGTAKPAESTAKPENNGKSS